VTAARWCRGRTGLGEPSKTRPMASKIFERGKAGVGGTQMVTTGQQKPSRGTESGFRVAGGRGDGLGPAPGP